MKGERKDPRKELGAAVSALAEQDPRIVILSADSGGSSGFSMRSSSSFAASAPLSS